MTGSGAHTFPILDDGLVSQEEFDAARSAILESL